MRGSTNISKTDPNQPDYVVKPQKALKAVVVHFLPPILQVSLDCGGSLQRKSNRQALEAQDDRAKVYAELARLQNQKIEVLEQQLQLLRLLITRQVLTTRVHKENELNDRQISLSAPIRSHTMFCRKIKHFLCRSLARFIRRPTRLMP